MRLIGDTGGTDGTRESVMSVDDLQRTTTTATSVAAQGMAAVGMEIPRAMLAHPKNVGDLAAEAVAVIPEAATMVRTSAARAVSAAVAGMAIQRATPVLPKRVGGIAAAVREVGTTMRMSAALAAGGAAAGMGTPAGTLAPPRKGGSIVAEGVFPGAATTKMNEARPQPGAVDMAVGSGTPKATRELRRKAGRTAGHATIGDRQYGGLHVPEGSIPSGTADGAPVSYRARSSYRPRRKIPRGAVCESLPHVGGCFLPVAGNLQLIHRRRKP